MQSKPEVKEAADKSWERNKKAHEYPGRDKPKMNSLQRKLIIRKLMRTK